MNNQYVNNSGQIEDAHNDLLGGQEQGVAKAAVTTTMHKNIEQHANGFINESIREALEIRLTLYNTPSFSHLL